MNDIENYFKSCVDYYFTCFDDAVCWMESYMIFNGYHGTRQTYRVYE